MYETKPLWPSTLGALTTAVAIAVLGTILLFQLRPPSLPTLRGPEPLDLMIILETFRNSLVGQHCAAGIEKLIGIDCRIGTLVALTEWIRSSTEATLRVQALLAAMIVGSAVTLLAIHSHTPKREQERTIRGKRPVFDADGRRSLRAMIARTGKPLPHGLWLLPHVQLTPSLESYNILALGTQGSGKTSMLRALTEQCIERGDRVFVHDAKGDMTAGIPVKSAVLVAPHDRRSWAYDIAADIRNAQHAREFAEHAIGHADHDPMWGKGAQGIWADLVMALARENQGRWTWQDLAETLLSLGGEIRAKLEAHGATSASRLIFDGADPEENRTTRSLLITLWIAAITVVLPLAEAWSHVPLKRRFSLNQWLGNSMALPRVIVLQRSSEYASLSTALGGFLIDRLAGLAMNPDRPRSPSRNLVLCVDEFPELGRLSRLPNLLNVGREFGLVTIGGLQDIAHLIEVYGEEMAQVLLARFRVKLIHQLDAGDTAERVGKLLGERLVVREHPTEINPRTGKPAMIRELAPVFEIDRLETELGVILEHRKKVARIMVLGLGNPAIVNVPITGWPDTRPSHVPAAWLNAFAEEPRGVERPRAPDEDDEEH